MSEQGYDQGSEESLLPAVTCLRRALSVVRCAVRLLMTFPLRAVEWFNVFTLATFSTVLFLVAMYTVATMSFFEVSTVCLNTSAILHNYQVYRLFTYGAFHSSIFHLVINVLFLASVGRTVEGKLGTWYLLNVVLVFSVMCAFIQMLLEYVISFVYPPVLDNCLPGFSGILFGILVLALGVTKGKNHNVFGLFTVPKMLYPWLLLAVSYVLSYWEFSVTANLAGLIIGYAYMHDFLNIVKLSPNMILVLEHSELCFWMSALPGFVYYPKNALMPLSGLSRRLRRTKSSHRKRKASLSLSLLCSETSPSHDTTPDVNQVPESPLYFEAPDKVEGPNQSDDGARSSEDIIHV